MKTKLVFMFLFLPLVVFAVLPGAGASDLERFRYVPREAPVILYLDFGKEDAGIDHLLKLLLEKWKGKTVKPEHLESIGFLSKNRQLFEYIILISYLDPQGKSPPQCVIQIRLREGLTADQYQKIKLLTQAVLKRKEVPKKIPAYSYEILFSPERRTGEIGMIVYDGNDIFLSTQMFLFKEYLGRLETLKRGAPSLASDGEFAKRLPGLMKDSDCFVYVNNQGSQFIAPLRKWEEEYKMMLFLSPEGIKGLSFSCDLVDNDTVRGKLTLTRRDSGGLFDDLKEDAYFFDAVIKRKFIAEKINYSSSIRAEGEDIVLDLKVNGMSSFWSKIFENKGKAILRKDEKD